MAIETPTPTPETGVVTVAALLDLSGPRAALGNEQRDAINSWLARQAAGESRLKVGFVDVASADAKALLELKRASIEQRASAVIVGSAVRYDDVLGRAVELAARPVLFLEPIRDDPAHASGGQWAFALAPSLARIAAAEIRDAQDREALVPSLVLLDGVERIDPAAVALGTEFDVRGLTAPSRSAVAADGTVSASARSAISVMRGVFCFARLAACSSLARDARGGPAHTVFYLPWTITPSAVRDLNDLWPRAVWPSFPVTGSAHAATAADALALLAAAARTGGSDPARLRDALEGINMRLIATTYSFTAARHEGADPDDLVFVGSTGTGQRVLPPPTNP